MNKLSINLKCVIMRNGVEIWKEDNRLNNLTKVLTGGNKIGFIEIDDELINSADIVGIFTAKTMEDLKRRKNGQYKCRFGVWHDKGEYCDCKSNQERIDDIKKTKEFLKNK